MRATENADQMFKTLTLRYNHARQAGITNELMIIVGAAEAIRSFGEHLMSYLNPCYAAVLSEEALLGCTSATRVPFASKNNSLDESAPGLSKEIEHEAGHQDVSHRAGCRSAGHGDAVCAVLAGQHGGGVSGRGTEDADPGQPVLAGNGRRGRASLGIRDRCSDEGMALSRGVSLGRAAGGANSAGKGAVWGGTQPDGLLLGLRQENDAQGRHRDRWQHSPTPHRLHHARGLRRPAGRDRAATTPWRSICR